MFGEDFRVAPYIAAEYERARNHKWYMSGRMICVNDLYAFDKKVIIELEQFTDVIGRHFKQPAEGLGMTTPRRRISGVLFAGRATLYSESLSVNCFLPSNCNSFIAT